MKKYIFIFFIFVLCESSYSQSLFVAWSKLFVKYRQDIFILKDLNECHDIQGYAVLDSENIFIAYDPEKSAEASTIISVYNIKDKKELLIREIGGTGESYYSYNSENGCVAFKWYDGIYVFKLFDKQKGIIKDIKLKLIKKFTGSGIVAWISTKKLLLFNYEEESVKKEYINMTP
jgi:hypothetical protein